MSISVEDMLQSKNFNDLEVIAGKEGLARKVKTVNVMDAPDVHRWLKGGEFLITTAYVMKDNPRKLKDLIINIEQAGAAAFGIKLTRFIDELPDEVLRIADQLNFPIIFIPKHYAFTDIINPLLSEIINKQAKKLSISTKIHKSFTQLVINGGDTQAIINTLEKFIDKEIAFYDKYFNKLYLGKESSSFKEKLRKLSLDEILIKYYTTSIEIDKRNYGYIIQQTKGKTDDINDYEELALEHAETVLKLNIQKKISNHQIETRYRDQFVQDLLFNNINSLKEVKKRANLYNWKFNKDLITIIVDIDNFKKQYEKIKSNTQNQTLEEIKRQIFLKTRSIINLYFNDIIYTTFSDSIVFLIKRSIPKVEFINKIKEVTDEIRNTIRKRNNFTVTIGVGKIKSSVMKVQESYNEAQEAVDLGREIYQKDKTIFYNDLGAYKVLGPICKTDKAEEFYKFHLRSLIDYDQEKGTELVQTLEYLIDNNWNLKETSKELFIHYNTMKYRFKRIKEILNVDLNNSEQKFNIALALKLLKMAKL